jgi:uncharacterized tellurite resistance protein B-like protein
MLTAIRNFFERHIAGPAEEASGSEGRRGQMAAAALLIEVVLSDESFSHAERETVLQSVRGNFSLSPEESTQLVALAETAARDAHDLYQFTSQINANFSPERKVRLIEEMWRAAYADAVLHRYEEHLIRRVSDLLHVPHAAFIAAKLRILDARSRG